MFTNTISPLLLNQSDQITNRVRPLKCRHVLERLAWFGQRVVGSERLVVKQLAHGDVGELLHQLEGVVDIEEHGEEMFSVTSTDANALRKHQGGVLLQLGHLHPRNNQGH